MKFKNWDDIRIALAVARTGTVSGAAELLGVHHATVIRRVDALEAQLGTRLFQRHARGYATTEAGRLLQNLGTEADERLAQMVSRIMGAGDLIEGELVVTSLPDLADVVMPLLIELLNEHPGLRLRYVIDARMFRLAAGEAHIAIRAGAKPTEPDYVVLPLLTMRPALFAARSYLETNGPVEDLANHRFALQLAGVEGQRAPFTRWIEERVPPSNIVFISNDHEALAAIVHGGQALGVLPEKRANGLVKVMSQPEWESQVWLVTHVDMHRAPKVRAALAALRGMTTNGSAPD